MASQEEQQTINPENPETKERKKLTRGQLIKEKLLGSLKFSLIFAITIHTAMIVIGAMNLKKCPVEPQIPIFLLTEGVIGIVTKLISLFRNYLIKKVKLSSILSFIATFELTIFIAGSYYIYKEFQPSYYEESGRYYCNKTVYLFSFVYITIVYSMLLLLLLGLCCFITGLLALDRCIEKDEEEVTVQASESTS